MTLFEEHDIPLSDIRYKPVLAATAWRNNAELILDLARIGYLQPGDHTLDATYGRGHWWTRWRPLQLVTNDLDFRRETTYHHDFRDLPIVGSPFDVTVFDPPYIAQGGRETSTEQDFIDRFGLVDVPKTPEGVQDLINAGLTEMHRITAPGGYTLVKCKDYVTNGALWLATHLTVAHALELGYEVIDRLEHLSGTGPQPYRDYQLHARRNLSTLFVLRK